jgi:hypothetical protein
MRMQRNSSLVPIAALVVGLVVAVTLLMALPADAAVGIGGAGVARLLLTGLGGIAFAALLIQVVLAWLD